MDLKFSRNVLWEGRVSVNNASSVCTCVNHCSCFRQVIIDLEDTDSIKECVPDDHHSPVKPDDYIRLRLYPMMEFYRDR